MAKDLASPDDTQVRLQAVETWGQSAPTGAVDPLIQALKDHDAQVQARALELIVQDWAREQAARSEASP
jgi:HEAT repeat protein